MSRFNNEFFSSKQIIVNNQQQNNDEDGFELFIAPEVVELNEKHDKTENIFPEVAVIPEFNQTNNENQNSQKNTVFNKPFERSPKFVFNQFSSFSKQNYQGFTPIEEAFYKKGLEIVDDISKECTEVPFFRYYPVYNEMSNAQLNWYIYWRSEIRKGNFLETDYSYYYIYLYEIINLIGIESVESGLLILKKFFKMSQGVNSQLDKNILNFIKDYIIYYNINEDYFDVAFSLSPILTAKYFWLENLSNFLEKKLNYNICLSISESTSYNIFKSHFYKNKYSEFFNSCCEYAFLFIHKHWLVKKGGVIKNFWNTKEESEYIPFLSAVFFDRKECKLDEIRAVNSHILFRYDKKLRTIYCNVPRNWTTDRWQNFATSFLKYIEYRLRVFTCYKYQIKEPAIMISHKKILDKAIDEFLANYTKEKQLKEKKTFQIDMIAFENARAETFEINNSLIEKLQNSDEECEKNKEVDQLPQSEIISDKVVSEPHIEESNFCLLNESEIEILNLLLYNKECSNEKLNKIASDCGCFLLVFLDNINEKLYDIFSDCLIDTSIETPYIFDDYKDELTIYLNSLTSKNS